jgi:hypothetical protein
MKFSLQPSVKFNSEVHPPDAVLRELRDWFLLSISLRSELVNYTRTCFFDLTAPCGTHWLLEVETQSYNKRCFSKHVQGSECCV